MAIVNDRSGGQRTTLTLSITPDDKRLLKQAALDRETSVAELVHQWVQREFGGEAGVKRRS